jgi:NADPH-dependent 2,4-dienoyl-CoA reductase/sulfur reductase-like enzyme
MPRSETDYDILVIGAGPAGIAAACEAADAGKRVGLVEGSPWLGGQIWKHTPRHPAPREGQRWLKRLHNSGARILLETRIVGLSSAHRLLGETRDRAVELHGDRMVLATGARERFIPFPGWTLPGIIGVGGLQALAKSGWPVKNRRIVVAGSGPLLLAVAAELRSQGAHVVMMVEQAAWRNLHSFGFTVAGHPSKMVQGAGFGAKLFGTPLRAGWWPVEAHGSDHLERLTIGNGRKTRSVDCDLLACAFGLVPNVELPRLLEVETVEGRVAVDELQCTSQKPILAAGEVTGIAGVDSSIVEGRIAGLAAAGSVSQARTLAAGRDRWQRFGNRLSHSFSLRHEVMQLAADETIVCRCEDVTLGEIKKQSSARSARLQCRCGMGHCQGRVCGDITQTLLGWKPAPPRPPLSPVRFNTMKTMLTRKGDIHDV